MLFLTMSLFKTTLLLSLSLTTGAFAQDSKLSTLSSEILGQIGQNLSVADLARLDMTGDKLLALKTN